MKHHAIPSVALPLLLLASPAWCGSIKVVSAGAFTTNAARAEQGPLCAGTTAYPPAFTWATGAATPSVPAATSGTPKIEQYRGGALIATYTSFANQASCAYLGGGQDINTPASAAASGCGPFTRSHGYRLAREGDQFLVYPAVYSGDANQPWFGPMWDSDADYSAGIFHTPDNVTISGVVQNNRRPVIMLTGSASYNTLGQAPVYFDTSTGMVLENLDISSAAGSWVGKAGVYIVGASNLTLRNMRVSHFEHTGGNGIFGAGGAGGFLLLDRVELDHNGGTSGPAHNAYIGASTVDPNYSVTMINSWSHDAYYGHLFKSRAQINTFIGDYFEGGVPQPGKGQAEAYLVDIPNGGILTMRNSVLVKNAAGYQANGIGINFASEGMTDARPQYADIENNSFVSFARTFDGVNANVPMGFFWPRLVPGDAAWPANVSTRILKNAFVGFCTAPYRGDVAVTEAFSELSHSFALTNKLSSDEAALAASVANYAPVIGTSTYKHHTQAGLPRRAATLGAMD